ncbi:MAG TPA: cytochrome c peroxidase [Kofleriaceae bacterium]
MQRLAILAALAACTSEDPAATDAAAPQLPATPYAYNVALPPHVMMSITPGVDNTPAANPITDAGATLGRVLFFDKQLSISGTISCSSCHRGAVGFADDVVASAGFADEGTARNAMALEEVRFYSRGRMFWDERAATLEDQVLQPIQNEIEMGMTLDEVVARINRRSFYPPLFTAAFGDGRVTSDRIARALAQYVRSIASWNSKWDQGVIQVASIADPFPNFSAEENRGKTLFFGQHDLTTRGLCGTCHMRDNPLATRPPMPNPPPQVNLAFFQSIGPTDNGLPTLEGDLGVGGQTGVPQQRNLFKPSSLRNVAVTAPYMHDGRFATLEEVVDYYDHGITATPNLHPLLRNADGTPLRLQLSPADRSALVAFLKTLTDTSLASDPRFSDPFVQ